MRRSKGFTLIETIIVVGLLAAALAITLSVMSMRSKAQQAERLTDVTADEMAMIVGATRRYYTAARVSAIAADNVRSELPISTLITEGLLPAQFANRFGAVGTSVYGHAYKVAVVRLTGGKLTFVVYESGVAKVASLSRAGIENTPEARLTLKQTIVSELSKKHSLTAGVLAANSAVARGGFASFQKDISLYVQPLQSQEVAVVLAGFPDLEIELDDPTNPPGGGGLTAGKSCIVLNAALTMNCQPKRSDGQYTVSTFSNGLLASMLPPVVYGVAANNQRGVQAGISYTTVVRPNNTRPWSYVVGNECTSLAPAPTCPAGMKEAQRIPAKCLNPSAGLALPGVDSHQIRGATDYIGTGDDSDGYAVNDYGRGMNQTSWPESGFIFPSLTHISGQGRGVMGDYVTGYSYSTMNAFPPPITNLNDTKVPSAAINSSLTVGLAGAVALAGNSFECVRAIGTPRIVRQSVSPSQGGEHTAIVYRFVPGAFWTVCCEE